MDRGEVVAVDLREGIENTLIILGHKLKKTTIEITKDYDESLGKVTAHGAELNQVWTNLLDNAIDALGSSGHISIVTRADGDCAEVDISDDGPGIPPEVRDRVFDPFFTTKEVGRGTGLGLDTARRIIVDRHHGSLTLETRPGRTHVPGASAARTRPRVPDDGRRAQIRRAGGPGSSSTAASGSAAPGASSASTLPPKPPPTIRAPSAPCSTQARDRRLDGRGRDLVVVAQALVRRVDQRAEAVHLAGAQRGDRLVDASVLRDHVTDAAIERRRQRGGGVRVGIAQAFDAQQPTGLQALLPAGVVARARQRPLLARVDGDEPMAAQLQRDVAAFQRAEVDPQRVLGRGDAATRAGRAGPSARRPTRSRSVSRSAPARRDHARTGRRRRAAPDTPPPRAPPTTTGRGRAARRR